MARAPRRTLGVSLHLIEYRSQIRNIGNENKNKWRNNQNLPTFMIWSRVKCRNQSIKRGESSESNYSLGNQFCLQTFRRHEKNRFTFGPNIPGWYRLSITFKSERIFIRRGFIYIFRKLTAFIRISFSTVGFSIGNYYGLAPDGIIYRLWGEGEVGQSIFVASRQNSPDPSKWTP